MTLQSITIRRPDDWHVHLRDGDMLKLVAPYTARQFARAIVMPNLAPPVTTAEHAAAYRKRIVAAAGDRFEPLMTCYLTDDVDPDELARGHGDGVWLAAKLYPAGATTNSSSGVTDIRNIYPALERMQAIGVHETAPRRGSAPYQLVFESRVANELQAVGLAGEETIGPGLEAKAVDLDRLQRAAGPRLRVEHDEPDAGEQT